MIERSLGHLGRSGELKKPKNVDKVERGPTDQPMDGRTKRGVESRSTRLKMEKSRSDFEKSECRRKIFVVQMKNWARTAGMKSENDFLFLPSLSKIGGQKDSLT